MKIALLGLDTSHGPAFARVLQKQYPGYDLVAAWPGGTPDILASSQRVGGFSAEVHSMGVPMADTPEEAAAGADAVLLLALDGAQHLPLARRIARPGLRLFVDKPMANNIRGAREIFDTATTAGMSVFSASALPFLPWWQGAVARVRPVQEIRCVAPLPVVEGLPRYHFYGIHAAELLVSALGSDVEACRRCDDPSVPEGFDLQWSGGAVARLVFESPESRKDFAVTLAGHGGTVATDGLCATSQPIYAPLLREIVGFFESGTPPVTAQTTLGALTLLERLEAAFSG